CVVWGGRLAAGGKERACVGGRLGAGPASRGPGPAARIRHFYEQNEQRLARILEQGRRSREFRFAGDARATASLVFSLLEGAVLIARAQDGVKQFRSIGQQLMRLLHAD